MLKFNKFLILLSVLAFWQVGLVSAQNDSQTNFLKWEKLSDENNEFMVFIPQGYLTTAQDEYYLGKPSEAALVKKLLKVARLINGVFLMLEYYQGNSKDIYETLKEREKSVLEKEEAINGYQIRRFSTKTDKLNQKTHYYFKGKSLYVLKSYAKTEDDKIVKSFFDSVRLVNQNNIVAPNAPKDAKNTSLLRIIEQEMPRLDDSAVIDSKDADRPLIILQYPRPRFSTETRRGIGNIRIKLKVLFSSSGKVSKVEVVQITSKLLEREAIETAKNIIFIPAEKDGKLVSVYQNIEYSFGIETR